VRLVPVVGRRAVDQRRRKAAEIVDGRLGGPLVTVQTVADWSRSDVLLLVELMVIGHRNWTAVAAAAVELRSVPAI